MWDNVYFLWLFDISNFPSRRCRSTISSSIVCLAVSYVDYRYKRRQNVFDRPREKLYMQRRVTNGLLFFSAKSYKTYSGIRLSVCFFFVKDMALKTFVVLRILPFVMFFYIDNHVRRVKCL